MAGARASVFPTINVETEYELIPKHGVYVTEVGVDEKKYQSVTNIGYNPTFGNIARSIETFILDYSADLYGKEVTIYFHDRIRGEKKFDSVDELKKQIDMDVEATRTYFVEKPNR